MKRLNGKSVNDKIAIGKIHIYQKNEHQIKRIEISDKNAEVLRFEDAREQAKKQLQDLYAKALKEVGEYDAMIFETHKMLLDDSEYVEGVATIIRNELVNVEYAVGKVTDKLTVMLESMDDEYVRECAIDIRDVSDRLLRILQGNTANVIELSEPAILVAEDLQPSETIRLDKSKVLAIVTRYGALNSHTAILAKTMNIPALVEVDYPRDCEGKEGIVQGREGVFYIEPDNATKENAVRQLEIDNSDFMKLQQFKDLDDVTLSGQRVNVYANIDQVSSVDMAIENGASGIGLFRSEFLYLGSETYPTEEEQFLAYKAVASRMVGKKVVIRTLDIGADKQIGYFELEKEDNPALGYRAIRICLDRKDIFKTQLRAIYRASVYGNVAIMYPMIISVDELQEIKKIVSEVKEELEQEQISYRDIEQGIMIETPAAVMISDLLAKEVDFFSIGTNDLTQYTLAIDRQNAKLDSIFNPHHEAILRMIQMVVDNAHKSECSVAICGELGADESLTEIFVKMGIDELSVSPSSVLKIRKIIRGLK